MDAVQHEDFIRHFERVVPGALGPSQAERAIKATLSTLAECLPAEVAHYLAEQLPLPLKVELTPSSQQPQRLSLSEFAQHVAEREQVSPSEAIDHARATVETLSEAVTGRTLEDLRLHLPSDLAPLFSAPAAAKWPETHRQRTHD